MMRRTINLLLMLLFVAEVTSANTVDFDKAFKECARIEKQIKRTSFPKRTFLITTGKLFILGYSKKDKYF